jgi:hypothetical protein
MSAVLSFADGQIIEPKEEVIDMIEGLLARAKEGQVVALAYACVRPDGTAGTGYNEGLQGMQLIAATAILAHRITGDFAQ